MNFFLILIISFFSITAFSQSERKMMKTCFYKSKYLTNYSEYDERGNVIFRKHSWKGKFKRCLIEVYEYDSLNRQTKMYSLDSYFGWELVQNIYDKDTFKEGYFSSSWKNEKIPLKLVKSITSKEELIEHPMMDSLKKKPLSRLRYKITESDENNNPLKEDFYIEEKDKDRYVERSNHYQYDDSGGLVYAEEEILPNECKFKYYESGVLMREGHFYSSNSGGNDTTEVRYYMYNDSGKLVEEMIYKRYLPYAGGTDRFLLVGKTINDYNEKGQRIHMRYYCDEDQLVHEAIYSYNENGYSKSDKEMNYSFSKSVMKLTSKYRYTYW